MYELSSQEKVTGILERCLKEIYGDKIQKLEVVGIMPYPLKEHLSRIFSEVIIMKFPDHHNFSSKDLAKIISVYEKLPSDNRCVITTEKDSLRLKEIPNIVDRFDKNVYYIPIGISFLNEDAKEFNNFINNYVRKNRSNNLIS